MNDLISRKAAIDGTKKIPDLSVYAYCSFLEMLFHLPSAQPEIIRCKECKFYDARPCGIVDWYNTADDFCSNAERRTDG